MTTRPLRNPMQRDIRSSVTIFCGRAGHYCWPYRASWSYREESPKYTHTSVGDIMRDRSQTQESTQCTVIHESAGPESVRKRTTSPHLRPSTPGPCRLSSRGLWGNVRGTAFGSGRPAHGGRGHCGGVRGLERAVGVVGLCRCWCAALHIASHSPLAGIEKA